MRLGYCCINTTLGVNGKFKTTTVKSASKLSQDDLRKKLKSLTVDNLYNTLQIIKWNIEHNIKLYRLSSDLVPLATHEIHNFDWKNDKDVIRICDQIKDLVKEHEMKISFHPSQYLVLSSDKETIINNSIKDLEYHNDLANMVGCHTILIHCGGKYGNTEKAMDTFVENFNKLPIDIQNKLHIENDDRTYNVEETLSLAKRINVAMILDLHHARVLPSSQPLEYYINDIMATWKGKTMKVHLSSGREFETDKKHADYVAEEDFNNARQLSGDIDYMLENKMKELGVFKLINK